MRAGGTRSACQKTSWTHLRALLFAHLGLFTHALLAATAQPAPPRSSLYAAAQAEIRAGNFDDGCAKAEHLVRLQPKSPAGYNLLGLCTAQKGDAQRAEVLFRKSVALGPQFADARNNLATQLAARGQYQAAIGEFREVLRVEPANVTALYNLARIELGMGRVNPATARLQRAFSLAPNDVQVGLTFASALCRSKHPDRAAEILPGLIEQSQQSGPLLTAAVLAAEANRKDLAQQAIKKALDVDPETPAKILALARIASNQKEYPVVAVVLGSVESPPSDAGEWNALEGYAYYKLGQPEKALPKLQRALELDPNAEDSYMKMGELMLYYKSQQPAISYFQAGLKLMPDSAMLHYGLAVSYVSPKFFGEQASHELEAALQVRPEFDEARLLYCMVLYQLKDPGLNAAAQQLMERRPHFSEGYYYKALALQDEVSPEARSTERIAELFRQAIRLKPAFEPAYVEFGKFLAARGDWQAAVRALQKAVALDPKDPEPIYQLAQAYRKTGQPKKSLEAFQLFNKMQPQQPGKWEAMFQLAK